MSEHETAPAGVTPLDEALPVDEAPAEAPAAAPAPARESLPMLLVRFVALLYVAVIVALVTGLLLGGALLNWRPYLVTSGSMIPTMNPGDLVVVENAEPGEGFSPPTIITFRDPDRGLVTHRVIAAERAPNGELRYTTKGDANPSAESGFVSQSQLVGSVRFVLREIGGPLLWAQQRQAGPFAVWALGTLLAVWLAVGFLRPAAPKRRDS